MPLKKQKVYKFFEKSDHQADMRKAFKDRFFAKRWQILSLLKEGALVRGGITAFFALKSNARCYKYAAYICVRVLNVTRGIRKTIAQCIE